MENGGSIIEVKSGPIWYLAILGVGFLLLPIASFLTSNLERFSLNNGVIVLGVCLLSIWASRMGEMWVNKDVLRVRGGSWRIKSYNWQDLKWIEFHSNKSIDIWIGDRHINVSNTTPRFKKIRSLIEVIGQERLSYYNYNMPERSSLVRGQLSGCLDCHEVFPPEEIKNWIKAPKSFWAGRKIDEYYPRCPSCNKSHVQSQGVGSKPVTKVSIQEMSTVFQIDPKTGLRTVTGKT